MKNINEYKYDKGHNTNFVAIVLSFDIINAMVILIRGKNWPICGLLYNCMVMYAMYSIVLLRRNS